MTLEPVSELTMAGITAFTLTVILGMIFWSILYDEWQNADRNIESTNWPDARPFAEKIIALVDGQRIEVVNHAIEDAEVALASRRISPNPLANTILEVLQMLPVGTAYEATRIATRELELRVWRTA